MKQEGKETKDCVVVPQTPINPFSTGAHFYIYSAYYLTILYNLRNSHGITIVQTLAINLHRPFLMSIKSSNHTQNL